MVLRDSFATAAQNMRFDEELLATFLMSSGDPVFRFYEWQNRGLTYSEKRIPDSPLLSIDHSPRVTGGGVVFHGPGDIVFSIIMSAKDPRFPRQLKGKMVWVSDYVRTLFENVGVLLTMGSANTMAQDIMFCNSYYNPYELYFGQEKVCGIALRKYRDAVIFQGVIHLTSSFDHFPELVAEYGAVFTRGLSEFSGQVPKVTDLFRTK